MNKTLLRWSFPLLLPSLLVAQIDTDPERPLAAAIDLPLTATHLRASTGRIGIDPYLDTVTLVQDGSVRRAFYLQDPTQHNVAQPIADGIVDVAVLNGANGADRDPILVLRSNGLEIQECATGANSQLPAARPILTSWSSALGVWTGRKANGQPVALGLGGGGRTITRWDWTAGNLVKQPNDITVPTGITKMMTVDFDGTGEVEIVVLYPSSLYVLSWTGTVLQHLPFSGDGSVHMTVSRGTGPAPYGRDLVVACGQIMLPNQIPQQTLFLFNATTLNALPLTIAVGDLTAADGPARDGLDDIVIADGLNSRFHVFQRLSTAALVNSVPTMFQGVVHNMDRENAPISKVVGGDFDNDGDGDLLGLQSLQEAQVTQISFGRTAPLSQVPFICDYANVIDGMSNDMPSAQVTFSVPLQVPNLQTWLGTGHTMSLEVTTWFRPSKTTIYEVTGTRTSHALTASTTSLSFSRSNAGLSPDWSVEIRARMVATKNGISTPLAPYRVHHATAAAGVVEVSMDNLQNTASGIFPQGPGGIGSTGGTTGGSGASQTPPKMP